MQVRCATLLTAPLQACRTALALGTLLGLGLQAVRPGSELHPHWMGSTGSLGADRLLALSFGLLVLLETRRPSVAFRALQLGVGASVVLLAGRALAAHLTALSDGRLAAAGLAPPVTLLTLVLVAPWTLRACGAPCAGDPVRPRRPALGGASVLAAGLLLAAAQITAVGATDYRASADAILVLGSRVHADGRPSGSLRDRTTTAAALWHAGLAPVLVLSGGRGADAPVSEPAAMARLCRESGLPEQALIQDLSGLTTEASIHTLARLARERGWREVLVVSHDYHLARVRLLAAREGLRVRTVPVRETCPGGWKLAAGAREMAAYLAAWLLP